MLVIPPPVQYGAAPAVQLVLDLAICSECKPAIEPRDLLTDEWWSHVEATFRKRRLIVPDRERARIEWKALQ